MAILLHLDMKKNVHGGWMKGGRDGMKGGRDGKMRGGEFLNCRFFVEENFTTTPGVFKHLGLIFKSTSNIDRYESLRDCIYT